jgi:hypothetical protein
MTTIGSVEDYELPLPLPDADGDGKCDGSYLIKNEILGKCDNHAG